VSAGSRAGVPVEAVELSAFTVPTESPEADGTLEWDSTTLVLAEARAGGRRGVGWSYTHAAAAEVAREMLVPVVAGRDALDVPGAWEAMRRRVRNVGRPGIASAAISAVDTALWDLKARLLDLSLVSLLGAVREAVPLYGSGGFTSYDEGRLREQLGGWAAEGFGAVKMKVGRPDDRSRVRAAREAVGDGVRLMVDANGAFSRKEALARAEAFAGEGVAYFEEPVSSDDLEGLRLLRDRSGVEIAAGEYGWELVYFRRMLEAGAVDVLQADVTRCGGITELLRVGALCAAWGVPLSAHTAPMLHAHAGCAIPAVRDVEWFRDHARIEAMFFDGALEPVDGALRPDRARPGLGVELRRGDAARFAV
jgi:L-alanine-DL-glutamate epimerase-like enolase superfamily enzyme